VLSFYTNLSSSIKDDEERVVQVQFAKNIPLDTSSKANDDKASILVACIGVTSGYSLSNSELFCPKKV
jgi:hypothetical protein